MNKDDELYQLGHQSVGRLLWHYSLPAVVGMLVQALYNVVDRIFIGQWAGPAAFTGLTVTFPLMNIATAMGVLVGAGACARISIALGRKELPLAGQILGNAFVLTFLNAAIYLAGMGLFLEPLLRAFGASDVTLPYARSYILILMPGLLLTNVAFSLNNIMRSTGYPRKAMMTMLIGAAVNLVLDPIFIRVLDMGIAGAALATDIAMAVSALFVLRHFVTPGVTIGFRRHIYRLKWPIVAGILSIGAAPAIINAASCFINAFVNRALVQYAADPDTAIGAAGIFVTFTSLSITITLGICQGMQPIVGYNYGAGNIQRLTRTFWLATAVGTVFTLLPEIIGLSWPDAIALAFSDDAALRAETVVALRHSLWAFGVVGFQMMITSLFQSLGQAGKSIFLGLVRQVIFLLPLLWILPQALGVEGVWLSFPTSDVFSTLTAIVMLVLQLRQLRRCMRSEL